MEKLKGSIYVALAAASYGVLASMVKYANLQGIHISILTAGQFFFGLILLFILQLRIKQKMNWVDKRQLLVFGLSFGATSLFYYLSLLYIPVSIAIILLMQAIWMGVVLEIIRTRKLEIKKIVGAILAITGTIFAADAFNANTTLNFTGIVYGILAALSYTCNMYASNEIAAKQSSIQRSFYFILGGSITVLAYWNTNIIEHFQLIPFLKWGFVLALFGTILPPLLFTVGMPKIGTGLGGIVSSFEIPVSLLCAYLILGEELNTSQYLGVIIILLSILLINLKKAVRTK